MAGLQAFMAFAESARQGNFAGAARELGLSASAVAKSVARLEEDLGLRLFHRTTRKVTLTSEGQDLYVRCRRVIDEIEAMRGEAESARGEPSGTLRLDVPSTLGRLLVVPVLAQLVNRHPLLALEVSFSDQQVDVVEAGLDAVIRIGELPDSSLVAWRIGIQVLVACASPEYLSAHGTPTKLADLSVHRCLVYRLPSTGRPRPWQFRDGSGIEERMPASAIVMNDGEALVAAAAEGMGIVQAPHYMVAKELRAGRIVEVLHGFRPKPLPISLVYPSHRRVPPRVRALMEAFTPERVTAVLGSSDATPARTRRLGGAASARGKR
jgi:LysR family transcriptional regulator for bpeEF and oprC